MIEPLTKSLAKGLIAPGPISLDLSDLRPPFACGYHKCTSTRRLRTASQDEGRARTPSGDLDRDVQDDRNQSRPSTRKRAGSDTGRPGSGRHRVFVRRSPRADVGFVRGVTAIGCLTQLCGLTARSERACYALDYSFAPADSLNSATSCG